MAKTHYATVAHEWFEEVWNQRSTEAIDRLLGAHALVHGITDSNGREVRGPEAFKAFHKQFLDAFPDFKVEVADTVSQGNKVAVRCIVRGTHRGGGLGFAPTGKPVVMTGMAIAHVQDGKIVEAWNDFDFLALHTQIGTLPLLTQKK